MNVTRANIAFIPPKHVAEHAVELCGGIAGNYGVEFELNAETPLPHLTVFSPELPADQLDLAVERMAKIASKNSPVSMRFTEMDSLGGWVFANVENSQHVAQIHQTVLDQINPLRQDHQRGKYQTVDRAMFDSETAYSNVVTYGSSLVGELYNPHLTITRLIDRNKDAEVADQTTWNIPEFTVDAIGIFEAGEHGTCTKLLHRFNLA